MEGNTVDEPINHGVEGEVMSKMKVTIKEGVGLEPGDFVTLDMIETDSANAVRLEFQNADNETIFTISADNKVTLHGDVDLDEASQSAWEAVERTTPSASWRPADLKDVRDRLTGDYADSEARLIADLIMRHGFAHVALLPASQVKGFGPRGLDRSHPSHSPEHQVLVINNVGIIGITPGSVIHKSIERALETEPPP